MADTTPTPSLEDRFNSVAPSMEDRFNSVGEESWLEHAKSDAGKVWKGIRNSPASTLNALKNSTGMGGPTYHVGANGDPEIDPIVNPIDGIKNWWSGMKEKYGTFDKALDTWSKDPAGSAQELYPFAALAHGAVSGSSRALSAIPEDVKGRVADAAIQGVGIGKGAVEGATKPAFNWHGVQIPAPVATATAGAATARLLGLDPEIGAAIGAPAPILGGMWDRFRNYDKLNAAALKDIPKGKPPAAPAEPAPPPGGQNIPTPPNFASGWSQSPQFSTNSPVNTSAVPVNPSAPSGMPPYAGGFLGTTGTAGVGTPATPPEPPIEFPNRGKLGQQLMKFTPYDPSADLKAYPQPVLSRPGSIASRAASIQPIDSTPEVPILEDNPNRGAVKKQLMKYTPGSTSAGTSYGRGKPPAPNGPSRLSQQAPPPVTPEAIPGGEVPPEITPDSIDVEHTYEEQTSPTAANPKKAGVASGEASRKGARTAWARGMARAAKLEGINSSSIANADLDSIAKQHGFTPASARSPETIQQLMQELKALENK